MHALGTCRQVMGEGLWLLKVMAPVEHHQGMRTFPNKHCDLIVDIDKKVELVEDLELAIRWQSS